MKLIGKYLDPAIGEGGGQADVPQSEAQSPVDAIAEASTSDAAIEGEHAEANSEEPVADKSNQNNKEFNFKQMRGQVRQLQDQIKALEGASNLERWLKSSPDNMRVVMDLMQGRKSQPQPEKSAQNNQEDPYKDYEPFVAEQFRKLAALEQWKAEQEKKAEEHLKTQEQKEQEAIHKNMADLDEGFNELLIKDGFMGKDGVGDQSLIEMIQDAVLARAARLYGDPTRATRSQMIEAYKAVTAGLSAHQKFTLKKTVTKDVPLSGSTRGSVPSGKTTMNEQDRVNTLIGALP